MDERLPARLDREALERVIRRAAELQAGERGIGEEVSTDEVLALGREVGIPERHLHQALLEERARLGGGTTSGTLDRIAGPGALQAQRVVQGTPESAADLLVSYLEDEELFCVQRRQPQRILFEPLGGFQATMRRSSATWSGKRPYLLAKAGRIVAGFSTLEPGYVHVLLEADLRAYRGGFVGGGAAITSVGAAGTAVLVTLGAMLPIALLPLPIGAAVGWGVTRVYRDKLERVELGLERALDHLEERAGIAPRQLPPRTPGLLSLIVDEVRRGIARPD